MPRHWLGLALVLGSVLPAAGCGRSEPKAAPGVDVEQKTVVVGALNDESGPGAPIGRPWAAGKRLLARHVNGGGSGLLPEGWRIRLVERDHGYDVARATALFAEIRPQILFLGTSFGTPQTLALRPMLERDRVVAFPASVASSMQESEFTPPLGTSCRREALRAIDWAVARDGAAQVKLGLVYQQDEYGRESLAAVTAGARSRGVVLVASQGYDAGQPDYTALVAALKQAGATHVVMASVPSATGPILGIAAQLDYRPQWLGHSPSWSDRFFDPQVVPPALFAGYHWVMSGAYWGEDVPFMRSFLAAYEQYGRDLAPPDFYILASYVQGVTQLEIARRMIEAGEPSRDGYYRALRSLKGFDAQRALPEAPDFTQFPYRSGSRARVLQPDFESRSWKLAGAYAAPAD